MIRATELLPDQLRSVIDITAEPIVRERLLELGVAPGRKIKILRELPFSGPVILQSGSLVIALRREEAEQVWVEDHE